MPILFGINPIETFLIVGDGTSTSFELDMATIPGNTEAATEIQYTDPTITEGSNIVTVSISTTGTSRVVTLTFESAPSAGNHNINLTILYPARG